MVKVQAWERLNDPEQCRQLGMVEFKELLLRAGYREEVAHKAALKRGWDRLEAGVTM